MANDDAVNAAGGLRPLQAPYGNVKKAFYRLTTNATVGVYIGSPMDLDANGRCILATTGSDLQFILGPALGFADTDQAGLPSDMNSLSQAAYLPANKDAYVLIADDPDQEFVIQANTSGLATTADVGTTARFDIRVGNGSSTTGSSWAELKTDDIAADSGGSLRIVRWHNNVNADGTVNTSSANYAKLVVKIFRHRYGAEGVTARAI